jgi:hypothetical protein
VPYTLPASKRREALDAIVSRLKRDDALRPLDILWRIDDGRIEGDDPLPQGRTSVRLTPEMGTAEPFATCGWGRVLYRCAWKIRVELRSADDHWGTAADLWEAIERALFARGEQPSDVLAAHAEIQAAGVDELEVTQPADTGTPGYLDLVTYLEG